VEPVESRRVRGRAAVVHRQLVVEDKLDMAVAREARSRDTQASVDSTTEIVKK
jgi:hypothetical protein